MTKTVLSVLVVAVLACWTAVVTIATLTARVTNADSRVTSGTLVLRDELGGGRSCTTDPAVNDNVAGASTCAALFDLGRLAPGDTAVRTVTITNLGSIPAASLTVDTPAIPSCSTVGGGAGLGTRGDLCHTVRLFVRRGASCVWPSSDAGACAFSGLPGRGWGTLDAWFAQSPLEVGPLQPGPLSALRFTFAIQLPADAGDDFQDRATSFLVVWQATN